jgi:hypothetical protein
MFQIFGTVRNERQESLKEILDVIGFRSASKHKFSELHTVLLQYQQKTCFEIVAKKVYKYIKEIFYPLLAKRL